MQLSVQKNMNNFCNMH